MARVNTSISMSPETAMAIEQARGDLLFSHFIEMVMREYLGFNDGEKDDD